MKPPKPKKKDSIAQTTELTPVINITGLNTALRKRGYSQAQIKNRIKLIIRLNLEELKDMYNDPNATILEKIVANALKKDIEKGEMNSFEKLLNRVFNISKVSTEMKDDFFDKIEITYVTKKIAEIETFE